jgi:hypothetical protein
LSYVDPRALEGTSPPDYRRVPSGRAHEGARRPAGDPGEHHRAADPQGGERVPGDGADAGPVAPVSAITRGGIPSGVQGSEELPDDVPVADAVEQHRPPVEPVPDEEASAGPPDEVPLEAAAADWREQLETVELDAESDEVDRP